MRNGMLTVMMYSRIPQETQGYSTLGHVEGSQLNSLGMACHRHIHLDTKT